MGILLPRYYCDSRDRDGYCRNSSWYSWGRWVAFAVIVTAAFMIFFLFACYNARRRRSHGLRPHPGTSWMAPPSGPPPPNQPYYADPYYQQQPPPQYTAQPQAYGYFGGQPQQQQPQQHQQHQQHQQQSGIELQSPPHAYAAGGDRTYQPPPGPPPQGGPKV